MLALCKASSSCRRASIELTLTQLIGKVTRKDVEPFFLDSSPKSSCCSSHWIFNTTLQAGEEHQSNWLWRNYWPRKDVEPYFLDNRQKFSSCGSHWIFYTILNDSFYHIPDNSPSCSCLSIYVDQFLTLIRMLLKAITKNMCPVTHRIMIP